MSCYIETAITVDAKTSMKAAWNGKLLLESDDATIMEGNHNFPAESIVSHYFVPGEL